MCASVLESTDDLLRRAASGDQPAFEALVGPHLQLAYRLALTMLGDPAAAEDAVQEATFRTWRHVGRLRPGSSVRAWFLTVVANHCRSQLRSRWWRVLRGLEQTESSVAMDVDPASLDLERALLALDERDRAAIFLRYCEDLPLADVAAALGITMTAARSRIHRALRRLRLQLDDEELRG